MLTSGDLSLRAARAALGDDLTPERIAAFVDREPHPLKRLHECRGELKGDDAIIPPPLPQGETRPILDSDALLDIDAIWATLLYAHSVAVDDPLSAAQRDPHSLSLDTSGECEAAMTVLHQLGVLAPLIDSGVVVLFARADLPPVKLNLKGLEGPRWLMGFEELMDYIDDWTHEDPGSRRDLQMHPALKETHISDNLATLVAAHWRIQAPTRWFQVRPGSDSEIIQRMTLRWARRRVLSHPRAVVMSAFDRRALAVLTQTPVPDLSGLNSTDITSIRDEGAFGDWRLALSSNLASLETMRWAGLGEAHLVASRALREQANRIHVTVRNSSALSAFRNGGAVFAAGASAALASVPILGPAHTLREIGLSAGASLLDTGRRLLTASLKRPTVLATAALARHYDAVADVLQKNRSPDDHSAFD
ncbi:MAG: hypothetical protein LBK59_06470 [Bifidobacteriaceae bacterium]|jgi:hypothetical protein|nr:hypothetical protein [Bifidobacteriaceae bacterium]